MSAGRVSILKEELADLESAKVRGQIKVVDTKPKLSWALRYLRKYKVVGFDTETRPSFRKGQVYKVSLIQLSVGDKTFLIRINKTGFTKGLIKFLEDPEILKIGLSLKDDFHSLRRLQEFEPSNFIDLQQYVKNFLIEDNSLSKIYAVLFGKRICKAQRLTNWEAEELSLSQQQYAALDAMACLEIFNELNSGNFNPFNSPYFRWVPRNLLLPAL